MIDLRFAVGWPSSRLKRDHSVDVKAKTWRPLCQGLALERGTLELLALTLERGSNIDVAAFGREHLDLDRAMGHKPYLELSVGRRP